MENLKTKTNGNGHYKSPGGGENVVNIHDYLAIFYRGRWIIMGTFFLIMVSVCYYTFTTPPTFKASTTIMIDNKQGMGESLFNVSGFAQQRTLINNQVELLKSRALAMAVIEHLMNVPERDSIELVKTVGIEKTKLEAMAELQGSISVSPIRDTELIIIDVLAPSSFEAAFLANSVAEASQNLDRNLSRGETSQVVKFLEEQLKRKEKDLKVSEETLKRFLEKEKIASLSVEATQIVEQGAEFESLYKGALIEYEAQKRRLDYLKGQLGKSKDGLEAEISRVSSPLVLQLRNELADIERNIAVFLSQGVSEDAPQVRIERDKRDAIKKRVTEEIRKLIVEGLPPGDPLAQAQELVVTILEVETEMASLEARGQALKKVVDDYSTKLESLPDKNVQLARLERNRKVDENLYMMMREKYEESRITQAGQIGKIRIIDTAIPPQSPISPKKKMNMVLGVFVGLGLGIGITFFREYMDTSVRRVEDIEALGFTVIGAIPSIEPVSFSDSLEMATRGRRNRKHLRSRLRLVTHLKPKSPVSESYRTLRTNIQFSESQQKIRSILVTSAGPGEGKSTTAANLAIAMSQQGTRTILIDTDLRRPVLHRIFELNRNLGVSNVLAGKNTLDEVIQKSTVQNMDILTCGILPPNPAEMLGSKQMEKLVRTLGERYDFCIFDSPPLIAVTDAAVLAKGMDGVLVVVKSGRTHREALSHGIDLLENVRARIMGILLNDVSRANTYGSYYYYYYYHYYYYYGESGDKKRRKDHKRHHKQSKEIAV